MKKSKSSANWIQKISKIAISQNRVVFGSFAMVPLCFSHDVGWFSQPSNTFHGFWTGEVLLLEAGVAEKAIVRWGQRRTTFCRSTAEDQQFPWFCQLFCHFFANSNLSFWWFLIRSFCILLGVNMAWKHCPSRVRHLGVVPNPTHEWEFAYRDRTEDDSNMDLVDDFPNDEVQSSTRSWNCLF